MLPKSSPPLLEAKVKAGIFVEPQIKTIIEYDKFAKKLNGMEKGAWNSFVEVVGGFFHPNHKTVNYVKLV